MKEKTNFLNEMTNLFIKTWTRIDIQALKSWFNLMELAQDNTIADGKPELEFMTQRFIDLLTFGLPEAEIQKNQHWQFHLVKLSYDIWQDLLSKFESGEDWQQALSNHSQKLQDEVDKFFQEKLKTSQDIGELWQIYIKEVHNFNQLLSTTGISGTGNPWIDLNNIYWNFASEQFGNLMRLSLPDPSDGLRSKLIRAFDAWAKLYPTSIDYQMVLVEIQRESFNELMLDLILLASKGEKVKDWLQFQQLWGRTADKVFEKAFCSEDNVKVRGRFLNAINNYKLSQQDLMEMWMKMMNMPIRSEVDEVHKSIYELRKEVKSLKKTLAKYEEK